MTTPKHYDGQRFYNPTLTAEDQHKSFWKGLRMWMSTPKATWPKHVENKAIPNLQYTLDDKQIAVTFVNHVTFLLQLPGLTIVTDPVWSKRASPFSWLGPIRVREPGVKLADLPPIDLVLLSHNHYDHLDVHTLRKLHAQFAPQFYIAQGDGRILNQININSWHELDWWNTVQINANTKITFTPMQHWSARSLRDQCQSLWGSYVIEHNGKKIFFGGDGGYCSHFKDIHARFGDFDLAFIGIGAYEPRWFMQNMHTNPEEAVLIHQDLHCKLSIGMHFGTFQLSAESIEQPLIDLHAAKQLYNIPEQQFVTLNEGETRLLTL